MANLKIPSSPQELTPEWLTDALRETDTITQSSVVSLDMETGIQEGRGFLGELARVALRYDQSEQGAPASLIAKLPTSAPESREVAHAFRFYEREVRFYEEIGGEVELRTPRCYYSRFDGESGDFVLLMEDLAPARVGDQLAGCSADAAGLCIRDLAKFHATWWESSRLADLDWMPSFNDPFVVESIQDLYPKSWEPFVEFAGDKLSPSILDIGKKFESKITAIVNRISEPPRTIVHGDFRLDNLFFGTPEGGAPLTVIDWQLASRARGVFDVAYFICGTVPPAERKASEMSLLRMYHGILLDNGVRGYDFDQCFEDYRLSVLLCLGYSVLAAGQLDMVNERGVELFTTIMERTTTAMTDLNAGDLLRN